MKKKIINLICLIFAPVLTGALLFLAFPGHDVWWLAWLSLAPLLLSISGRKPKIGFLFSLTYGTTCYLLAFKWMFEVATYSLLLHAIVCLYRGLYLGFFGLAFSFIFRRTGPAFALLTAPFIWVALEYSLTHMGFMAHPWTLVSHSQYSHPLAIQTSSLMGAYGVSFMIVLVNSAIAAGTLYLISAYKTIKIPTHVSISKRGAIVVIGVAVILSGCSLLYGQLTISETINGEKIKLTVIQGNIDQKSKWDAKKAEFIMKTYARLTHEALRENPSLIIWPETATPGSISRNPLLYMVVKRIAEKSKTDLLIGSGSHEKFKTEGKTKTKFHNSAFLIKKDTKAKNQYYNKIKLVPFGEYVPAREKVPWSWIGLPDMVDYLPGKEFTIFEGPGLSFGVTICWETIFPNLVRQFVKNGAQLMINLTNEAWFGETAAPYQALSTSVFRAVENRVFVVRCANTGISCFIDPHGRVVDRVKDASGRDLFVQGVLTGSVVPMNSKTIYTQYGDWFAWLCIICSVGFLAVAFIRKIERPQSR